MASRGRLIVTAALVAGAFAAPVAEASPWIHAHRGGTLETAAGGQTPERTEETLSTLEAAAGDGFVLEIDVKLTSDGVPVLMHDATLERTTDCEGRIDSKTAAQLRSECEVDLLGTAGNVEQLPPGDPRRERIPTLAEALDLARSHGSEVNLEIKNVPTDPDFDPAVPPAFATTIADAIKAAGFPPSLLIVQSFWPANLDVFAGDPYFAEAETSLLTLAQLNEGGPAFADESGYDWVSPAWPVSQAYISEAHSLGLQVVPYTIDDAAAMRQATRRGVDAIITNDPGLARATVKQIQVPKPPVPAPPPRSLCRELAANRLAPPIESYHPDPRAPRVFAMQFKQDLRHVVTYEDFRAKIECMIREYVRPRLDGDRANVVAFNEDIGLMTLATGSRGAAARAIFEGGGPSCEPEAPCGVAAALAAVRTGYDNEAAVYTARFPTMPPVGATFVAGTDTFGRGWMRLFSEMAKRYDVYILGSNNQAPFRESRDPADIAAFADPDHATPDSVYVATRPLPYNEVFMWAPRNVRREGPRILRNVVTSNRKVPVTPIEEIIQIEPGPKSGPDAIENLRPYRVPGTKARISFATSKPAFEYGDVELGAVPSGDPCADVSVTYMPCLDKLGTNLVMQDEANPGRWTGPSGEGNWTPLEWMRSTWRAVADPEVDFDYNVTPHMVGNLADLPFDGQTAITQRIRDGEAARGARGGRCTYVGDTEFMPGPPEHDAGYLAPYAGRKREFIGLAPWVAPDGPRDELRETGAALAPGSGEEIENDYLETAIIADLPFPPDSSRPRCNAGSVNVPGRCANLRVGTYGPDVLSGRRRGDRIKGLAGDDRIAGRRGRDCLIGAAGSDKLRGNRGHDRVRGGGGPDRIKGGAGGDSLRGGGGPDRISGGGGPDRIVGGNRPDLLRGSRGNDLILARGGGRDRIRCGRGSDGVRADRRDIVHRSCERVR